MTARFITIENPDPIGFVVLVVGLAILFVAVWLMDKHDRRERPRLHYCQVCGSRIALDDDGDWLHVDEKAILIVRSGIPHLPEPLAGVQR